MTRIRPCGNPACRICRFNDEFHEDSGHATDESLATMLLSVAAIVFAFVFFLVLVPVLAA